MVILLMPIDNLFDDLPPRGPQELFQTLLDSPQIRIERIISHGQASPEGFWYEQDWHEWILLVAGSARLQIEDREPLELLPGSFLHIPAHQRHRVESTDPRQPTIWLAVHYGSRA
jgi:cupin 2 domain-containing protein